MTSGEGPGGDGFRVSFGLVKEIVAGGTSRPHHDHIWRDAEPDGTRPRRWHTSRATAYQRSLPEPVIHQCNCKLPDPASACRAA